MLGGVLQLAIQMPALRRHRLLPRIGLAWSRSRAAWRDPGVRRILRSMAPALLGVSVAQISLLINTQIASHVAGRRVSWLTYADRLMEFPTALLGVALGVVLMPQLAAAQARGDSAALLRHARLGPAPGGAAGAALRGGAAASSRLPLVAVLFHYGAFQRQRRAADVAWRWCGYGVGLLGLVGVKVLAPGFYAARTSARRCASPSWCWCSPR